MIIYLSIRHFKKIDKDGSISFKNKLYSLYLDENREIFREKIQTLVEIAIGMKNFMYQFQQKESYKLDNIIKSQYSIEN